MIDGIEKSLEDDLQKVIDKSRALEKRLRKHPDTEKLNKYFEKLTELSGKYSLGGEEPPFWRYWSRKDYEEKLKWIVRSLAVEEESDLYTRLTEEHKLSESEAKTFLEESKSEREEFQNSRLGKALCEPIEINLDAPLCDHSYSIKDLSRIIEDGKDFPIKEECKCREYYRDLKKGYTEINKK